jgi:hypothetical protein
MAASTAVPRYISSSFLLGWFACVIFLLAGNAALAFTDPPSSWGRLTVGGDQFEYPGDKSTTTAGLTRAKVLINSVISTQGAKFLVIDINTFYLNTPFERYEYMVINLDPLPQETIEKYDLKKIAQDGKVYIEIQKGMYGLHQAGILVNKLLQRNLAKDGYQPTTHTNDVHLT